MEIVLKIRGRRCPELYVDTNVSGMQLQMWIQIQMQQKILWMYLGADIQVKMQILSYKCI